MAAIKGIKERVHLPLYDSIVIKGGEQFGQVQSSNVLRFFQDVTGKTKLHTNMQASSLLPHWNTYEARAMRVVISDLAPDFPNNRVITLTLGVVDDKGVPKPTEGNKAKVVEVEKFNLDHFVEFKRVVDVPQGKPIQLSEEDLLDRGLGIGEGKLEVNEFVLIDRSALGRAADLFGRGIVPPNVQLFPNNGHGTLIGKFIYNTVTSFYVGEKTMMVAPTFFFPAGAGPYSEDGVVTTHGYPNPEATFRFAEAITIDTQQNFRVEIEIPENDVLSELQQVYGPFFIWVVIDGYMTRDVQ